MALLEHRIRGQDQTLSDGSVKTCIQNKTNMTGPKNC